MKLESRVLIALGIVLAWVLLATYIQTTFGIKFPSDNIERLYDATGLFAGFGVGFMAAHRS